MPGEAITTNSRKSQYLTCRSSPSGSLTTNVSYWHTRALLIRSHSTPMQRVVIAESLIPSRGLRCTLHVLRGTRVCTRVSRRQLPSRSDTFSQA